MLAALDGTGPDRLPVTTHHIMPYYLEHCLDGMTERQFWDEFGLDAYWWSMPHISAPGSGDYPDPLQTRIGFLESHRVANDSWRVYEHDVSRDGRKLTRYNFVTPSGICPRWHGITTGKPETTIPGTDIKARLLRGLQNHPKCGSLLRTKPPGD
jgi:hypothetical protein